MQYIGVIFTAKDVVFFWGGGSIQTIAMKKKLQYPPKSVFFLSETLKLTFSHLKMDGWKMSFLLGFSPFSTTC